jgi:hypothetical protein
MDQDRDGGAVPPSHCGHVTLARAACQAGRHGNAAVEGGTTAAALLAPDRSGKGSTQAERTDSIAGRATDDPTEWLASIFITRKQAPPGKTPRGALNSRGCSRSYEARTLETHRAALVPGLMQRQSDPQSLLDVHFTVGHPTVEAQPERRPPGLTQVQPEPQVPAVQSPAPEQVPRDRQRLVPPPISRQTQPAPQGLLREHAPAGQVRDGSGGGSTDEDLSHTPS